MKLNNFNVFIGLNGAGKSNLIMIFKIIKDIFNSSLAQAVSNEGGAYSLQNFYLTEDNVTSKLGFIVEFNNEIQIKTSNPDITLNLQRITDKMEWSCKNENEKFIVKNEDFKVEFINNDNQQQYQIVAHRENDHYSFDLENDVENLFSAFSEFKNRKYFASNTIIHFLFEEVFNVSLRKSNKCQISIYEFEQELLANFREYQNLSDDDSSHEIFYNMLMKILSDEEKRRSFFNLLNYVLPDIEDIVFDKKDEEKIVRVKEKFNHRLIPANMLSDGTIFLIVIILVLYYDDKYITIFDEPERRIHPHLISKVIEMMKDVAVRKQLILSTHNSEIVRNADPQNIFHIKRNAQGNSVITKPVNSKDFETFIKNDIGLDELFIQNLL